MGLRNRAVRPLETIDVQDGLPYKGRARRRPTEPVIKRGFSYTSGTSDVMSETPLGLMPEARDPSPFSCSSMCSSGTYKRRGTSPSGGYQLQRSPKLASDTFRRFIDVDVMKSLTDLSCKPSKPVSFHKALPRVVFYPLYPSFWAKLLPMGELHLLMVLWVLQASACWLYATAGDDIAWGDISAAEVYVAPVCLVFMGLVLGRVPTASQRVKHKEFVDIGKVGRDRKEESIQTAAASSSDSSSSDEGSTSENMDTSGDDNDDLLTGFDSPKRQRQDDFLDSAFLAESGRQVSSISNWEDSDDTITVLVWGEKGSEKRAFKIAVTAKHIRERILSKVDEEVTRRPTPINISFWSGIVFSLLPTIHRLWMLRQNIFSYVLTESASLEPFFLNATQGTPPLTNHTLKVLSTILLHPSSPNAPLHHSLLAAFVVATSAASVFVLTRKMVSHLALAEQTYHKRYLYAKFFSALTSLRRSQRYNLPHFRLKNVENVMAWLALRGSRAWLRLEPQEIAADSCVSLTFQVFLLVVGLIGMIVIREGADKPKNAVSVENFNEVMHGQVFLLALLLSYYLVFHFMMIGTSINHKYGNSSLLLTEQLNIQLRMVAEVDRPGDRRAKAKKEKLLLTNKVLELAAKLLKELEGPNKISGLSMNPLLYNITRVMVLSCLSAAFSHIVGFTPKLWKI